MPESYYSRAHTMLYSITMSSLGIMTSSLFCCCCRRHYSCHIIMQIASFSSVLRLAIRPYIHTENCLCTIAPLSFLPYSTVGEEPPVFLFLRWQNLLFQRGDFKAPSLNYITLRILLRIELRNLSSISTRRFVGKCQQRSSVASIICRSFSEHHGIMA